MLDELEDLVSNLGIGIVGKHLVKSRDMHAKFLCGTGTVSYTHLGGRVRG